MILTKWTLGLAVATLLGVALIAPTVAGGDETEVEMVAGPFAPGAEGELEFELEGGVLSGEFEAEGLPALGPHAFYVLWFVNMDTGDKAFLGPIINDDSSTIFFLTGGDGELDFSAAAFTDPAGPNAGSGIFLGPDGTNFFVLIAENMIDTLVPHPISAPPSSFALTALF